MEPFYDIGVGVLCRCAAQQLQMLLGMLSGPRLLLSQRQLLCNAASCQSATRLCRQRRRQSPAKQVSSHIVQLVAACY